VSSAKREPRPATFTCAWCGREKALARTGRPPKFCSDACRRAVPSAESALANARYHKAAAERQIAYYEEHLARYRRFVGAIATETSLLDEIPT